MHSSSGGYNHLTMLKTMKWAIKHNTPYFLMCESHLDSPRSKTKQWLKDRLLQWVFKNAAGGLPTGKKATRYLERYGIEQARQTKFPNIPDINWLETEAQKYANQRENIRNELGINQQDFLCLFVGRLIPKKGVHTIIAALADKVVSSEVHLLVTGEGREKSNLKALAKKMGLSKSRALLRRMRTGKSPLVVRGRRLLPAGL